MTSPVPSCHLWCRLTIATLFFILIDQRSLCLNTDGVLLLSLRYSVAEDPLSVFQSWNYSDATPCSWQGVSCSNDSHNVVSLSLASSRLSGYIPSDLGLMKSLRRLDLSNNSFNGSLPTTIFDLAELRVLDLSNNFISGEIPEDVAKLVNLQSLNLADNSLAGKLPANLGSLRSLTAVSLENNYLSGRLSGGFRAVEYLDLSSNLIGGSLPSDFAGESLRYLNLSYNRLSGEIQPEFGEKMRANATIDLSFNNLTGEIPSSEVFQNQEFKFFNGNPDLCGHPKKNPCPIPSSPYNLTNASSPTSPPAIAAIPKTFSSKPENGSETDSRSGNGLRPGIIVGIVVGDVAGVLILAMVFFYVYQLKQKKREAPKVLKKEPNTIKDSWSTSSSESKGFSTWSCLRKPGNADVERESESTESDPEDQETHVERQGTLVTVDGEELEMETLLKASAYILGATGSSIVYKAVLADGRALAVRRIAESALDRFKDFESQVRAVAKLAHPNLVRIQGCYWSTDEKLIIYDFVPNGSLANARSRKVGSSPRLLPWEARLKIAKGVARGLVYLHEKRHVHGNLKPSKVLLGFDMEPKIGDLGLERFLTGDTSHRTGGSARIFGSKRSTASRDDLLAGPSPSPSPSAMGCVSPYHAPESLRSLRPSPKWDVFSFGVILLELITGKIVVVDELGEGNGVVVEDKFRALRMADPAIRGELEGKEEALLACFRIGYGCASPVPQKRPTMKEVLQVLDKFPVSTGSNSSYHYDH